MLLLDEPTNHLDLESLVWFQEYLRNYPGAILMISHDREFLNQLVGSIVEIAHRRLYRYRGNWDSYVEQKAAREEQQLAAYKNQQKRDRVAPGIRRSISREGEQGVAGAEQAEADRSHGENRSAGRARKNGALPFSATAAERTSRHHVEGCRSRLRRSCCLSRTEFRSGTRAAHRAGRPERRRQIDAAENCSLASCRCRAANASSGTT